MAVSDFKFSAWITPIIVGIAVAWLAFLGNNILRGERLEGQMFDFERRISVAEDEIISLRARVRHLEQGGGDRQPEE